MAVRRELPLWLRLAFARLGMLVLVALPAHGVALSRLGEGAARRPYYTEAAGRLSIGQLVRLGRELGPGWLGMTALAVLLAILLDQLLTGAAFALFDPAHGPVHGPTHEEREPARVRSALVREGLAYLGTFLRTMGIGLLVAGVGFALVRQLGRWLDVVAWRAGWTGLQSVVRPAQALGALDLLWLASVGAWVFWCRLLAVADGRRRVRRTGLLVLRVFWRYPLRSWGQFVVLSTLPQLVAGAVLLGWRQAEPVRGVALAGWLALWLVMLLAQALVWVHLVRAGRHLYGSEPLTDLRARPDAPWGLLGKLFWWRRR